MGPSSPSALALWGDESVKAIGNAVGKYIDRSEPKDNMQACARICVEVDLGKGLPEAIKLKVDEWSYIQQLDYEQIPFKCKVCHEYGHFANRCTKVTNLETEDQVGQWETMKKRKQHHRPNLNHPLNIRALPPTAPILPLPNPRALPKTPPSPHPPTLSLFYLLMILNLTSPPLNCPIHP